MARFYVSSGIDAIAADDDLIRVWTNRRESWFAATLNYLDRHGVVDTQTEFLMEESSDDESSTVGDGEDKVAPTCEDGAQYQVKFGDRIRRERYSRIVCDSKCDGLERSLLCSSSYRLTDREGCIALLEAGKERSGLCSHGAKPWVVYQVSVDNAVLEWR